VTSSITWPFDSPHVICYWWSIGTETLSPTIFKTFGPNTRSRTHEQTQRIAIPPSGGDNKMQHNVSGDKQGIVSTNSCLRTDRQAGRRLDSAPSANVVAMATKIPLVVSPGRPKHIRSICHTSRLIGDFVEKNSRNLPKSLRWQQGSAPQHCTWSHWIGHPRKPPRALEFCRVSQGELTGKMARFHRETKKKRFEGAAWQTDRQTYRQTESTTKNNRLLV